MRLLTHHSTSSTAISLAFCLTAFLPSGIAFGVVASDDGSSTPGASVSSPCREEGARTRLLACGGSQAGAHDDCVGISQGSCVARDHGTVTIQPPRDDGQGASAARPALRSNSAPPAPSMTYYTCPMPEHSDVRSDKSGTCPRC